MWGGRFDAQPSDVMTRINASIDIDKRLYKQDINGSKAHAAMLVEQGIIPAEDGSKIQAGLDQILDEIEAGSFEFTTALEDIHMNVESRLKDIIGEAAGKLHTARSRNDQVATDFTAGKPPIVLVLLVVAHQAFPRVPEFPLSFLQETVHDLADLRRGAGYLVGNQPQ